MSRYVAIECDGVIQVHASSDDVGGFYASLCGLDDDDPPAHRPAPLLVGARINCPQCIAIIRAAKTFRERDFETRPKAT